MKPMGKKIISVMLVLIMIVTGSVCAFGADFDYASIINGILKGEKVDLGNINIIELIAKGVEEEVNKESIIDKIIDGIKNPDDGSDDNDTPIVIDSVERAFAVELFNLTANRIKSEMPAATVTKNSGLNADLSKDMGNLNYLILGGVAKSAASDSTSVAAGAVKAMTEDTAVSYKIKTKENCNELVPLTGSSVVSKIKPDQVSDYRLTVYPNGAYNIHLEFPTVYGSAKDSGIGNVCDVTDNSTFLINLISGVSIDTKIFLKYVNSSADIAVNRKGEITAYNVHIEVTASASDGKTETSVPYLNSILKTLEKEGFVYVMETYMSGFNWESRKLGDVNNDTKVNTADAKEILRKVAKLDSTADSDVFYGDIDNNGKLSTSDAREILRSIARLTTLPDISQRIDIKEDEKSEEQVKIDNLLLTILTLQAEKAKAEGESGQKPNVPSPGASDKPVTPPPTEETDYSKYVNDGFQLVNDLLNGIFGKK